MTDTITAGSILVEEGTHVPKSLLLQSEANVNGWAAVKEARSTFEKAIHEEGWTFFFMAGEIKATVFGSGRQKALRGVEATHHGLEISALQQYRDYADHGQVVPGRALCECFCPRATFAKGRVFLRLTGRAPIRHSFDRLSLNGG